MAEGEAQNTRVNDLSEGRGKVRRQPATTEAKAELESATVNSLRT